MLFVMTSVLRHQPPEHPRFPKDFPEFERWFDTEAACERYLFEQRWPEGFVCPACGHGQAWKNRRGWLECAGCHRQTSLTAGTLFHRSRLPLRTWFLAMWFICTSKTGVSAAGLKRLLGLNSMQTAFSWLRRLRQAMVRPDREPLEGWVQVDDAWLAGSEAGKGSSWRSALIAVAVESDASGDEFGRIRLRDITTEPAAGLVRFIRDEVKPGTQLEVDGWEGYETLAEEGYRCEIVAAGDDPSTPLPRVRRVVGLIRRWLLGTHQGRLSRAFLQGYLDEFAFRYNRRKSPSVGMLFQRLIWHGARMQGQAYRPKSRDNMNRMEKLS